jgi:glycine betaine/proline transport system permease protein
MDWLVEFPAMDRSSLTAIKKTIDLGFRDFTRAYGDAFETALSPVKWFMFWMEDLLTDSPWILVLLAIAGIAYVASRSIKIAMSVAIILLLVGYFGMWEDTMSTIAMTIVATLLAIIVGIPVGILMARSDRVQAIFNPILDVMQTMPSFVYLVPVIMLLGIGRVPGLIAVMVYAIPPIIRLTNLGIRLVDKDVLEAADAFGSSSWQRLKNVQMPLALPTIMAGVNQTIMMALAMVVVAAMIGVPGLGLGILRSINNQYFTLGMFNGLAIVGIAIIFDRVSQAYGKRLQKHLEVVHG